jgi:hypothetical protein
LCKRYRTFQRLPRCGERQKTTCGKHVAGKRKIKNLRVVEMAAKMALFVAAAV